MEIENGVFYSDKYFILYDKDKDQFRCINMFVMFRGNY